MFHGVRGTNSRKKVTEKKVIETMDGRVSEKNLNRTWKLKSGVLVFESMKGIQLFLTS